MNPEFEWGWSHSIAGMDQPDKRQFGSVWWADSYFPGFPPHVEPGINPEVHRPFKPAANFTLGNLQRIWKELSEESDQFNISLKLPFEQWSGDEGYLKLGVFYDEVKRQYKQDSFSNFNDNTARHFGPWEELWSDEFFDVPHPITGGLIDVDYVGKQDIFAWYSMADLPVNSYFKLIGGARFEKTDLSIVNYPESEVTWIPPFSSGSVVLNPGDADVAFHQTDVLPSIGLVFTPWDEWSFRTSYSQTVARQTFKELSPIQQQEYLGGDVFIGNPFLQMSALRNYDLRLDYIPYTGSLISLSYFFKDIREPIEYVQRVAEFSYTTAVNYPKGEMSGYEIEIRQHLGEFIKNLQGFSVGANATFIHSKVTLPEFEREQFGLPNIQAPMNTRKMTNAPERLFNLFTTYDLDALGLRGTQLGLFYTIKGDTLIAGAGQSKGKYLPNVYEKEYGTLNMSLTQTLGDRFELVFQAKNLLDPAIQTVYRSEYISGDVIRSSYHRGMEFSLSVSATF